MRSRGVVAHTLACRHASQQPASADQAGRAGGTGGSGRRRAGALAHLGSARRLTPSQRLSDAPQNASMTPKPRCSFRCWLLCCAAAGGGDGQGARRLDGGRLPSAQDEHARHLSAGQGHQTPPPLDPCHASSCTGRRTQQTCVRRVSARPSRARCTLPEEARLASAVAVAGWCTGRHGVRPARQHHVGAAHGARRRQGVRRHRPPARCARQSVWRTNGSPWVGSSAAACAPVGHGLSRQGARTHAGGRRCDAVALHGAAHRGGGAGRAH